MPDTAQGLKVRCVPRIGFSSLTIDCSSNFDDFWRLEPESIELCRVGLEDWPRAEHFIRTCPVPVGLHCPLPFDGLPQHFEITGPNLDRQTQALHLVERTLTAAALSGASYAVVHFPTVFTEFNDKTDWQLDPSRYVEDALATGRLLERMGQNSGVAILIENVGVNPYFYSGEHFRQLFEIAPALSMCLDPGHAHVLPITEDVYQFTEAVAPYVSSVHFYNTNNVDSTKGRHYPPAEYQTTANGWMDLNRLLQILSSKSCLRYLVFEYSPNDSEQNVQLNLSRSREEINNLPWRQVMTSRL